jgi:hypothetical protein
MSIMFEEPTRIAQQKALMVHGMMLIGHADGKISTEQVALIDSYARTLPEFRGRDFQSYYADAKKVAAEAGGSIEAALAILSRIEGSAARKRLFACLLELAYAGKVSLRVQGLLQEAKLVLDIADLDAAKIEYGVRCKYDSNAVEVTPL